MLPLLVIIAACAQVDCGPVDRVRFDDIQQLVGRRWTGTLTYMDFSSKKTTSIPSTLTVVRDSSQPATWVWNIGYTDEPQYDSGLSVTLREDGRFLQDERVLRRRKSADGSVEIVTETKGKDDNRPAILRHVYRFGRTEASRQLLVKVEGSSTFFQRHIYRWSR